MQKKVGISIGAFQRAFGDLKALEVASSIGADAVDFSLEGNECDYRKAGSNYAKGKEAIYEYYRNVKRRADELGILINQTHGKLEGFRNIEEEDNALVRNTELDCFATATLGASTCVIHNATSIFFGAHPDSELMHRMSYNLFTSVLPFAKENNIKIATETFGDAVRFSAVDFFGDIEEFEKAYRAIKEIDELKDSFTVCVDTGHSNKAMRFGNPKAGDVIRRLGKEVTVLHLHDNDTFTDQHKMPFSGTIDWEDVFGALDEIGYNGVYNLELALGFYGQELIVDTAAFAVKVMKNYLGKRYN